MTMMKAPLYSLASRWQCGTTRSEPQTRLEQMVAYLDLIDPAAGAYMVKAKASMPARVSGGRSA